MTLKENTDLYFIKNNEIYIRVWSFQPIEVYQITQKLGSFTCNQNKSTYLQKTNFKLAYDWLVKKMKKLIGNPNPHIQYPIWAWYLVDSENTMPTANHFLFYDPQSDPKVVCLELEISLNQVVLTDFNAWHNVLNHLYYSAIEDDDEWEQEMDWIDMQNFNLRNYLIKRSWEKIFFYFDENYLREHTYLQATFWELKRSYIKNVIFYDKDRA
ncbi:MAG: DUF3841 domain-containing protein [Clostridia bacterium]|nr:DUF3841 domain-containing protein [Clostridia bacterium]